MVKTILLAFFLLGITQIAYSDPLNCIQTLNGAVFDFTPLISTKDYVIQLGDNKTLEFNICKFAVHQCNSKSTFANIFDSQTELECIQLSNSTKFFGVYYSLLDPEKASAGMQMKFVGGDNITTKIGTWSPIPDDIINANNEKTYSFALDFRCNKDVSDMNIVDHYLDTNDFTYHVEIETKHACPLVTLDQVSQFITDHKVLFFIIGILIGTIEAILGLRLFIPTLFVFGFVTGFFITMFTFFGQFITPESKESTKWILMVFAAIVGACIGYATVKMSKLGIFCIGAWFGIVIGLLLYNAFIYKIDNSSMIVFMITLIVFGLGFGVIAIKKQKHIIIAASSLCGSYLAVRSASLLIGHFPNEVELIKAIEIQDETYEVINMKNGFYSNRYTGHFMFI